MAWSIPWSRCMFGVTCGMPHRLFAPTYLRHAFAMSLKRLGSAFPLGVCWKGSVRRAMGTEYCIGAGKTAMRTQSESLADAMGCREKAKRKPCHKAGKAFRLLISRVIR